MAMSQIVYIVSLMVTLAPSFAFVGNPTISYMRSNYPNLGNWVEPVVRVGCVGLAATVSFLITLLCKWLSHSK